MTGCPNGCARPALGEIGFIGKAPGKYNMYLGAAHDGSRLNKMYRENIGEEEILRELRLFFHVMQKNVKKASILATLLFVQASLKQQRMVRIFMINL